MDGWNSPIGYDAIEGKLEVNEDEAKIVNLIFDQFIETASATAVVKHLKEKGHKTRGGHRVVVNITRRKTSQNRRSIRS